MVCGVIFKLFLGFFLFVVVGVVFGGLGVLFWGSWGFVRRRDTRKSERHVSCEQGIKMVTGRQGIHQICLKQADAE